MSPVSSRYIRAIYLLPGVKGGSEEKGKRKGKGALPRAGGKKRTVVGVVYKRGVGEYTVMI